MEELSLHLLDLVENSLNAGADLIRVEIDEDAAGDVLTVAIGDNGRGMDAETAVKALDPFFTTRTTRRVGLGLSLVKANAENTGGGLELESTPGRGTQVKVWFGLAHIDRQPLGDWPGTLANLILTRPGVDFVYVHRVGGDELELDTRELKEELGPEALSDPAVTGHLRSEMRLALGRLGSVA